MRELLVTSIGASMQLAIGRPIIWGRTVQLVWDNIRHILKPLLGSWAEFKCSVTSIVALLQGEAALLPQMLLRCNWKWAGLAYDAEQSNLFGTMSSAYWNCYLEVEPTCGFVATGPFLSPQFSLFFQRELLRYFNCCFDALGNRQSQHMRQNGAICQGQCQAHFKAVTWKLSQLVALLQQDMFCHLSPCFDSRGSCFDISTVASMHLAICGAGIWGRTVQLVWDNVKRILKALLGSRANLLLCCTWELLC